MFRMVKTLLEALQGIGMSLQELNNRILTLTDVYDQGAPLIERLEILERSRSQWEAEQEAQFVRAETEFKKARNAEERSKTVLKNAQALSSSDEGEEGGLDEYLELLRSNGGGGEEEGLQTVPESVAPHRLQAALLVKFGGAR